MKIGMIYDFGVNKGGGDLVMFNILEAVDNAGHDITLITSKPDGLEKIGNFFDRKKFDVKIQQVNVPSFFRHPYTTAYMARKIVNRDKIGLFVLSDDVPRCLSHKWVVCYIHFPHAARLIFREYVARKYKKELKGKIAWWFHKWQFPKFFPTREVSRMWLLIANSAVSMKHIFKTFHLSHKNTVLLNPPVATTRINVLRKKSNLLKEDLVVCIGRVEPHRRLEDLVRAMGLLKDDLNFRLSIIGFSYDESYLREIKRIVTDLDLDNRVDFL